MHRGELVGYYSGRVNEQVDFDFVNWLTGFVSA
jgi:hypothetical protein